MPNPPERLNRAEIARFLKHVERNAVSGCLLWTGTRTPNGYGKHRRGPGHPERVTHRIWWEHHHGPIPDGMQLDHLCRNRLCCEPSHLEPVTPSQNTDRQDHANRRKDTCPAGHPYDPANTRVSRDGKRVCRACERERKARARSQAASLTSAASADRA